VADVAFAKDAMVDFIVVGRPIYQSHQDPSQVVADILKQR
jgi:orotidine-5'-phosphate decarboxylase